jgi:hypothetical protein
MVALTAVERSYGLPLLTSAANANRASSATVAKISGIKFMVMVHL